MIRRDSIDIDKHVAFDADVLAHDLGVALAEIARLRAENAKLRAVAMAAKARRAAESMTNRLNLGPSRGETTATDVLIAADEALDTALAAAAPEMEETP